MTNGTSSLRVCVQRGGITCLFSSKAFSENDMTVPEMGGETTYCSFSRHTSFLGAHKGTHTSGGIGDFGACGGSNVTYFRRGLIQYAVGLNPPSFPLLQLHSVCLAWQMCGGLFWGAWDGSMPRVHSVSLISVETLMTEGSPYTKKQSHFFLPATF